MMLRLLLKLSLLLTLLATLPLFFIRAQPYDDSELRAFLTPPDGCPAPCFMGIRPGVTTAEEAYNILKAHKWTTDVKRQPHAILWTWDKAPSQWVDEGTVSFVFIINDQVDMIFPTLKVNIGDLMLLLCDPDWILGNDFLYLNSGIEVSIDSALGPIDNYNLVAHLRISDIRAPANTPTTETTCSRYVKYVRNLRTD